MNCVFFSLYLNSVRHLVLNVKKKKLHFNYVNEQNVLQQHQKFGRNSLCKLLLWVQAFRSLLTPSTAQERSVPLAFTDTALAAKSLWEMQQNLNCFLEGCGALLTSAAPLVVLLAGATMLGRGPGVCCAPDRPRCADKTAMRSWPRPSEFTLVPRDPKELMAAVSIHVFTQGRGLNFFPDDL